MEDQYIKEFRKKLGTKVTESREKLSYSKDTVATLMSLNISTIKQIEDGKFAYNIDVLARIDFILKCGFYF